MVPHRLYAKLFVDEAADVTLPEFVPVFHEWIRRQEGEDVLIDVQDYKHVHQGPGILLVGHEADYALDEGHGRRGLLYRRKRALPGALPEALALLLRQALTGALRLQGDPTFGDRLAFRTDEVEIGFLDKLRLPNGQASFARVRHDVEEVLADLFPGDGALIEWADADPRRPLTLHLRTHEAAALATLLERLEASQAAVPPVAS